MAPRDPQDLLPLTPVVLHILLALGEGERHGYASAQEAVSNVEAPPDVAPDDGPRAEAPADHAPPESDRIALDGFPRGRRAGDFFHSILEEIDFSTAGDEELIDAANEKLEQLGFAGAEPLETRDRYIALAVRGLREFLETPLDRAGLRLVDVPLDRRLSELEFRVPVAPGRGASALTPKRLSEVFRRHPSAALPCEYADRVEALRFSALAGFLKGYVDLVFLHGDRYYVVDYKTNHLGDFVGDYHVERMAAEMAESHYFLQYHLYTLAVTRLFERFVRGYAYETHFGGVYYLFMKGMRPGAPGGVFFEKPPRERLDALSRALWGEP
jgi:exodeoxyribonuclease V beta subunit